MRTFNLPILYRSETKSQYQDEILDDKVSFALRQRQSGFIAQLVYCSYPEFQNKLGRLDIAHQREGAYRGDNKNHCEFFDEISEECIIKVDEKEPKYSCALDNYKTSSKNNSSFIRSV